MHPARSIIYRIVVVTLVMTAVLSCIREEFDPDKLNNSVQINPNVGAPIGFLHFNLESMLNDSTRPDILEIHPDGSMTLRYKQRVFTDSLDNLFSFEDFSVSLPKSNDNGVIDLSILPNDQAMVINYTKKFDFIEDVNMNADYRIDSIWVRSVTVEASLSAHSGLNGQLQMRSQSFISEQGDDSLNMNVPFDGTVGTEILDNYTIIPEDNQLVLNFSLTLRTSDLVINPGEDFFDMTFSLSNVEFDAIFGHPGTYEMELKPQTMNISFFNSILDGSFHFKDPQLNIYITNSIGIPVQVSLPDFYVSDRFADTTQIYGDSIPTVQNPRTIGYPSTIRRHDTVVKHYDSLLLDLNRTNVPEILNLRPTSLTFSVSGEVDPPGSLDAVSFVTSDSYFSVDIELILPLTGRASLMVLMDTLEFDFTTFYDKPYEEIESLTFLVSFVNGFPVEVNAQMIFYEEVVSPADSIGPLFEEGSFTVTAGSPGGSICSVIPSEKSKYVEFTLDRIEEIAHAKYATVWAGISTYGFRDSLNVSLCKDHTFSAKIGVIVKANVNSADY